MDTYLLLRSNKQSGPYTLHQLVSDGLKPYDLVWVEGKSAAWRYPSEVDGLKDYAPATEEQPYDRFYKKSEDKLQEKKVNKTLQPQEETSYSLPVENKTVTTSRTVFVAMPENHVAKKQSQPVYVKTPVIVENRPVVVEEKRTESKPVYIKPEPVISEPVLLKQEPIVKEKPAPIKEEPTLNEKYSESLDDIKRRYTETYLSRKKKSRWTSTHTSILQVFGGAIFFCFLVVVAYKNFAGEDKPPSRTTIIQPDKRSINTRTVTNPSTLIPPIATETTKQPAKKTPVVKEAVNPPDESVAINRVQQKTEEAIKENEIVGVEKKAVLSKVTDDSKSEEVKPKTHPVNINRLVSVKANNYKQRAFGGVLNLELTVNNDSKFELDKVFVELQYLKPSEQPLKTEKIVFSSIEPNGSKTLKIPDYLRGVKVAYKVMGIESSQYERYTAGL